MFQHENLDPIVATKVLKIINEMMDTRDVTRLTPTLRSLFDNVVLPSFRVGIFILFLFCLFYVLFNLPVFLSKVKNVLHYIVKYS